MLKLTEQLKQKIFAQVMQSKDQADGPRENYLEKWRKSALYEACKLPGPMSEAEVIKGVDLYVEPVLREAIKEAQPQLLDSYTADGRLAVAFRSLGWNKNTSLNDLITFNVNQVCEKADSQHVIEKAIHDALGAGSSFVKVYVDEQSTHDEATASEWLALPDFMAMVQDGWFIDAPDSFATDKKGNVKGFEWKTSTGTDGTMPARLIRGTIPLIKIDKDIRIEFIESKDLWFDTTFADDFNRCRYACHRILTTVGECEKMGFDPDKLQAAALDDKDDILQELSLTGISDVNQDDFSTDPKERKLYRYEHYTYSSLLDKKGESKLYQVIATGQEVLEVNEIPFIPLIHAKKKEVVGSFYGAGFYDEAKQLQDALTKKYRVIDMLGVRAAYPRMIAVKGGYDKQSLLNNRPGSVIEAQTTDAVTWFPTVQLDNSFVESYQMLRESEAKSLRRGFGSANLEEIPPVSTAVVASALYADAQRGMELSKCIARTLIKPLYELVYKVMMYEQWELKDNEGKTVEGVAYPNLYEFDVDINTTGDDAAQSMQMVNAIQMASTLAQIQGQYLSDQNKYEMIKFILTRADMDADKFLTDPSTIPDDAAARQMNLILDALNFEAAKERLQGVILDNSYKAAQVFSLEQETINAINKTTSDITVSHGEAQIKIAQIQADAKAKADKIAVENKQTNYDALLGVAKQRHDNKVNGIM